MQRKRTKYSSLGGLRERDEDRTTRTGSWSTSRWTATEGKGDERSREGKGDEPLKEGKGDERSRERDGRRKVDRREGRWTAERREGR